MDACHSSNMTRDVLSQHVADEDAVARCAMPPLEAWDLRDSKKVAARGMIGSDSSDGSAGWFDGLGEASRGLGASDETGGFLMLAAARADERHRPPRV